MKKKLEIEVGKTHFVFESNDLTNKTAFEYAKIHQARNPHISGLLVIEISEEHAQRWIKSKTEDKYSKDEDK